MVSKHGVRWIEKIPNKELKEFLLHSTLVHTEFSNEFYLQWFPEIDVFTEKEIQCLLYNVVSFHLKIQVCKALIELLLEGIQCKVLNHLIVNLPIHLHSAVKEQDLILACRVNDPMIVNHVLYVHKALIWILLLSPLIKPVLILLIHLHRDVNILIIELLEADLSALSFQICLVEDV